jgi:1-deoxy-D-xylulose-5-phosphate synthase
MLHDASTSPTGPVAIRWPKTAARNVTADEVGSRPPGPQGGAEGTDVCILAVGKMLAAALDAAELLAAEGIEATVWDVRA